MKKKKAKRYKVGDILRNHDLSLGDLEITYISNDGKIMCEKVFNPHCSFWSADELQNDGWVRINMHGEKIDD